jgi:hypothetical protein
MQPQFGSVINRTTANGSSILATVEQDIHYHHLKLMAGLFLEYGF